jgi:molybdopterin-guanine dinucleotide biosynthesis protein A
LNITANIQPIVLVGGRSRRFGRDKLREPNPQRDGEFIVDRPIAALRAVFGDRVAIVGECHESIAPRADMVISDSYPGFGPIGGIISAFEAHDGDVFVLPGDVPWVTAEVVRTVLDEAARHPEAMAVLAHSQQLEPCVGIYRQSSLPLLQQRLAGGRRSLYDALPGEAVVSVHVDEAALINVNTPDALQRGQTGGAR